MRPRPRIFQTDSLSEKTMNKTKTEMWWVWKYQTHHISVLVLFQTHHSKEKTNQNEITNRALIFSLNWFCLPHVFRRRRIVSERSSGRSGSSNRRRLRVSVRTHTHTHSCCHLHSVVYPSTVTSMQTFRQQCPIFDKCLSFGEFVTFIFISFIFNSVRLNSLDGECVWCLVSVWAS